MSTLAGCEVPLVAAYVHWMATSQRIINALDYLQIESKAVVQDADDRVFVSETARPASAGTLALDVLGSDCATTMNQDEFTIHAICYARKKRHAALIRDAVRRELVERGARRYPVLEGNVGRIMAHGWDGALTTVFDEKTELHRATGSFWTIVQMYNA